MSPAGAVRFVVVLVAALAPVTINCAAKHDSTSLIVRADTVGVVAAFVVGALIFGVEVAVKQRRANERKRSER